MNPECQIGNYFLEVAKPFYFTKKWEAIQLEVKKRWSNKYIVCCTA